MALHPRWRQAIIGKWLCLLLLALVAGKVPAQSREYEIKAVFLLNFAQFTDWPTNAFAAPGAPFVIGVLGDDPFAGALKFAVQNEVRTGRKIVVEHYREVRDVGSCQILFISRSESRRLARILSDLRERPILTVSDIDQSAEHGVMVQFLTEHNKIRLRVNLDAVRNSRLVISSKLLRVAETISLEPK